MDLLPTADPRLELADLDLVATVAATVAVPRAAAADSFVLHAPLELLARAALLRWVPAPARPAARERIAELACRYEDAGPPVAPPAPVDPPSVASACAELLDAVAAGDLERVDALAAWLDTRATPAHLRRLLGDGVIASLAAAGHAPILLALLPHVAPLGTNLLRGPCRELARHPGWQLTWFDAPPPEPTGGGAPSLLDVPVLGVPGSDFIFPVMRQAETSGVAPAVLGRLARTGVDPVRLARELALVASWSMLQEPGDHVPYGWTHCLTMPQAVLDLAADADPRRCALVAATHVVGFRAAFGTGPLVADRDVVSPARPAELAAFASAHEDAHVVKHTLAALLAAGADPAGAPVHLAAAARLHDWWRVVGTA